MGLVIFILPSCLVILVSSHAKGILSFIDKTSLSEQLNSLLRSLAGGKFLAILRHSKYVVMLGFAVSAVGLFLLRDDFSINTEIPDLVLGSLVLGIGIGFLFSQLTNITMSAASGEQEAEASGFLNTSKNLGYSLGTALIGVILILGVFSGLTASLSTSDLAANSTSPSIWWWHAKVFSGERGRIFGEIGVIKDQCDKEGIDGRTNVHTGSTVPGQAG